MKIADESLVFPKRLSAYFLAVKESIRDDPAFDRLDAWWSTLDRS